MQAKGKVRWILNNIFLLNRDILCLGLRHVNKPSFVVNYISRENLEVTESIQDLSKAQGYL